MSSFFFRLEQVLRLRSRTERERARALGDAQRDEQSRRDRLREAATRLDRCGVQIVEAAAGTSAAGTLHNLNLSVRAVAGEVADATESHRDAVDTLAAERQRFDHARMERRVIERLRERREEDWRAEQSQEEQRTADELARHRRSTAREES